MSLAVRFTVGDLVCWALDAGDQRLDGGAMFGVVPKTLWEKRNPADERNRIPLVMRSVLVEHPDGPVLIDTGVGNKEDAKFQGIYGLENAGEPGPTRLEDAIRAAGSSPEEIRWVINTHLHFDHAGGNTLLADPAHAGPDAPTRLAFPNATYVVQRDELEFARSANERTRASYLPPNYEPVVKVGKFKLLLGDVDVVPGVEVRVTPGHVPFHQAVLIRNRGETAAFLGDLVPTASHLPLPWIMGYDLEPLRTLESKRRILGEAARERWKLIFDHDSSVVMGTAVAGLKGLELEDVVPHRPVGAG